MARDQYGVSNSPNKDNKTESSVKGLPHGYRITKDRFGLSLMRNGKLIRTSSDRDALVKYANEDAGSKWPKRVP